MSTELNRPLSSMTGTRQTMMTWAKVIRAFDEVPEIYREACQRIFGARSAFPYTVLAPVMSGTRHKDSEKLLCEVDDTFYVLERLGGRVTTLGYPWRTARDLEFGNILLYSWITLSGVTTDGVAAASTIVFNLATRRHFVPFINRMRPAPVAAGEAGQTTELAKLDALAGASFKFMNFARESLVPGEAVLQTVWQPDLRETAATVLGWNLYRTVALAHLVLLTDKELILIWDDPRGVVRAGTRRGGVWRYIPLRHVVSATLTQADDGLLTLSLGLTSNGRVDQVFAAARRGELEQLQHTLEPLIHGPE
jgi:hypothetical protein